MSQAPSPFLPGTNIQFALDSTSLGYFKTGPRLYQYIMLEGYQAGGDNIHLRFGTEFHKAMEDYEHARAQGADFEDAVRLTTRELFTRTDGWKVDTDTRPGKFKNRDSLLRSVVNYLDFYRNDPVRTYMLANARPAVELSFTFELSTEAGPGQPYMLCGHLDRVVVFNDELFVQDHKTTTSTPGDYFFNAFDVSNQMTLYSLGGQVVLGAPVHGVMIDAIQLKTDSDAFVRGFTFRTQDQLDEWQHDLGFHLRLMRAYAEEGHWPMNDTACGNYGGCKFRGVCAMSPHVREIYLRKFEKLKEEDRWNPLKSR